MKGVVNGGRNIMNQVKFIDMGSLNRNYVFNIAARGVRKDSVFLVCFLVGLKCNQHE